MFTLVRESVADISAIPNQQSWPIRITATLDGGNTAANIFVYHTAAPPIAAHDFFSCVAGAPQMNELPVGSGSAGVPFYRTNTLYVICRSPGHADEFWRKIQIATQDLVDNLSLVDSLSVTDTAVISPQA